MRSGRGGGPDSTAARLGGRSTRLRRQHRSLKAWHGRPSGTLRTCRERPTWPSSAEGSPLTTAAATGAFTIRQKLVFPELLEVPPDAPMTIEDETGAHWRPALRGCFALWTDNAAAPTAPADPVATTPSFAFGLLDPASDHALARLTPFWREVWERGNDSWYLQAGQYEYTPDHRPFIGPTPIDDLHLNTGYSGHGVMASAGGARRLVDLLLGRDDPDANPFRLGRPLVEHAGDVL